MLLFYKVEITEKIINPDLNEKKNLITFTILQKNGCLFYDRATDYFYSSLFSFLTSRGRIF